MFIRFKQNDEITKDDRRELITENNGQIQKLIVKNSDLIDKGLYTISVSNKGAKLTSKCEVTIIYPPKIIKPLQNIEVIQKKTAILELEVDSNPNATIEWLKNNTVHLYK